MTTKKIANTERLICALDVPTFAEAIDLVDHLGDSIGFYKLGLQLLTAGDYFSLVKKLRAKNKKIFADLKFLDIPQTVANAIDNLAKSQVDFCTLHADTLAISKSVRLKQKMKLFAVTLLTSHDQSDIKKMGYAGNVIDMVINRTQIGMEAGADGVIASGIETKKIREVFGDDFLIITPGVRDQKEDDDQKRIVTVEQAFTNGADYIVVGRPIRDAHDPKISAQKFQNRINNFFIGR